MKPDLTDLLGVLISAWFLGSTGALLTQTVLLLWHIAPPQRYARALMLLIGVVGGLYVAVYLLDIPSILGVLNNAVTDIPVSSSLRTGSLALVLTLMCLAVRLLAARRVRL